MASNYNLLQKIYEVHSLYQAQKTAEKGKIALLKQEAAKSFEVTTTDKVLFSLLFPLFLSDNRFAMKNF